jgi:hypothetical protein
MIVFVRTSVLAAVLVGLACPPAYGWGAHAHRIATRVAQDRLSPAAKAAVRELLHEGDTLASVANWADHEGHDAVPGSAPWHYVNVPISERRYDDRFCPESGCVVSKIRHFRKVLADRRAPLRERRRALLFLVHFVEDVHQPLHVGDDRDRGGNLTQVQFLGEGTNLHRLWDTDLIDYAGTNENAWVEQVERLITPEKVAEWSRGAVEVWASEGLEAARRAYQAPDGSGRVIRSGAILGEDYARLALPIARERLARAGVRLANELNAIFR